MNTSCELVAHDSYIDYYSFSIDYSSSFATEKEMRKLSLFIYIAESMEYGGFQVFRFKIYKENLRIEK